MSSPFVRRSATVTAGAVVLAGLVAAPVAAFAADDTGPFSADAVTVTPDPDGKGQLYTLTKDVTTLTTLAMPNDATLDGAASPAHRAALGGEPVDPPPHPPAPGPDAGHPADLDPVVVGGRPHHRQVGPGHRDVTDDQPVVVE